MQPKPTGGVQKFLFVFMAVGVVMLALGIKDLFARNFQNGLGLMFSAAMFTFIPLVIGSQLRKQQAQVAVAVQKRREDPTPWLRRADWAKREIEAKEIAPPFAFFVAAGVLVLIALWQFKGFHMAGGDPLFSALFFGIPLVVATIMAALGVRAVARQKKFGKSVFKLNAATGVIGGKLEGRIHGESQIELSGEFKVRLICHRQTGGGEHAKVKKLWDASQSVRVAGGAGSFLIPAVPAEIMAISRIQP
ncbi:MAG: hypothetical protein NTZ16_13740 [Verrucomicrobia bacterium]|nr:hypothetical protein [Verrucomicrobiota bacterium]